MHRNRFTAAAAGAHARHFGRLGHCVRGATGNRMLIDPTATGQDSGAAEAAEDPEIFWPLRSRNRCVW